jgi:NADPH:quinone reductase-like Zn-dependent oxidoreductase
MRTIEYGKCGPPEVLKLVEGRPQPRPAAGELLLRVRAAGLNPRDFKLRSSNGMRLSFGIKLPAVLGNDVAGEVVELGAGVTEFSVGDAVMAMLELRRPGAYAEFAVAPARLVARKPANLDFEQAAALPLAGLTALQLLRRSPQLGQAMSIHINGASGGVGSFAVQLARANGAVATGVTSSRNLDFVRSLGADHVIDYSVGQALGGPYDMVIDTVGNLSFWKARKLLTANGTYASCIPEPGVFVAAAVARRAHAVIVQPNGEQLGQLANLAARGELRSVVERVFQLTEEQVIAAHRHLETNRTRGKLVIAIS